MTQTPNTQLLTALSNELGAVRIFIELLQQEQNLLTENKTDSLLTLAEQKSALAVSLNQFAEKRRALLNNQLPESDNDAIQSWLTTHSPEGLAHWQEIRILAEQARQLNRINGELIQMKLRHNQQTLAALTQAARKADLYGPDGQHSFAPGSGRSLGSV